MRELTEPVDLAAADGTLRRDAIGWSRHPVHRCDLPPGTARAHVWHYWCVMDDAGALTVLLADVGFAGVALVSYLDLASGDTVERLHVRPRGFPDLPRAPRGDFAFRTGRLRLALRPAGDELRVEVEARTLVGRRLAADVVIARPPGHETMNVVVPWDETRFQFTSKQQALPARGEVAVDGRSRRLGDAFACLDFGRGRWPSGIEWSWAFASGRAGERTLGLNLGAEWTDGTGVTENAFVLGGRLHQIGDPVDFTGDPRGSRRIRTRASSRVDLVFTPLQRRRVHVPVIFDLQQSVGRFSGTLVADDGERVAVDRALGLAERVRGRWP